MSHLFENLNPSQALAVKEIEGPVMVLAGAGSGKTRTLVTRIQYLLYEKKLSPFQLLAVTFSNKAAREMRERVAKNTQFDIGALQITTFHAFCAKLLRSEAQHIGLSRNFTIYDTSEQKSIIKNVLGQRGVSQKEIHPFEVLSFIEDVKNSGHYLNAPEDPLLDSIDKDDLFYDFFKDYELELHKSNAIDFGGLITGVLNLFDNYPEVLSRYQNRFKYILVDEYQDTNRAQFKLIKLLSEKTRNICVVGDEDQSIYSWRGADIRNIMDFESIFPEAKLIKLEQNYRSSKNIIEAASCVIAKNTQRKGKSLWTDNEAGEAIEIVECLDDKSEAKFIASEVKKLIESHTSPEDIAIFYRTNAQSRQIEDSLRGLRIPYRVVAGIKFYERKEIKDLLAYLRVVVNDKDSLALSRVINIPTRGIGVKTLRKLEEEALKNNFSLWELMESLVDNDSLYNLKLSSKVKSGLRSFVDIIQEAKVLDNERGLPSKIYEQILSQSGYYESLVREKTYESQARLENLDELLSAIKQYENDYNDPSLTGFLETITLDSEVESEEDAKEVSMMTIHGSKGLEYPFVFVSGVEETLFPSFQSMESGEDAIEEERRLFYVAMTRAMRKLYILFAQGRMLWGSVKFNGPSRFISEIPEKFYHWNMFNITKNKSFDEYADDIYDDEEDSIYIDSFEHAPSNKKKSRFLAGQKVVHKLYGVGKVMDSSGFGSDEKVTIMFKDGARKKFMVDYAPLESLD